MACESCGDIHSVFSIGCSRKSINDANRSWLSLCFTTALHKKYINGGIMNAINKLSKTQWNSPGPTEENRTAYNTAYERWVSIYSIHHKQSCARVASASPADRKAIFDATAELPANELAQVLDAV